MSNERTKRTDWNGVVIGYINGKTAKGVMRYIEERGDFDVWQRTDGREYWVNPREVSAYMIDNLGIPAEYSKEQVMGTETARKWYSENTYRGDKE